MVAWCHFCFCNDSSEFSFVSVPVVSCLRLARISEPPQAPSQFTSTTSSYALLSCPVQTCIIYPPCMLTSECILVSPFECMSIWQNIWKGFAGNVLLGYYDSMLDLLPKTFLRMQDWAVIIQTLYLQWNTYFETKKHCQVPQNLMTPHFTVWSTC